MEDRTHAAPAGQFPGDLDTQLEREWLAVNGIGGYASATVPGMNTRKYHGLLVAAMAPPVRRMVLLSRVEETVVRDGWSTPLAVNEYPGAIHPRGDQSLRAFSADPFPRWAYQGEGWTVEKTLRLIPGQNTVVLGYTLLGGTRADDGREPDPVELDLRPTFALRSIHDLTYQWNGQLSAEDHGGGHHRIPATGLTPEVFFAHDGVFESDPHWYLNTIYRREQARGYAGLEDVWNPGVVRWSLRPGQTVHFACSTDPIVLPTALAVADARLAARDAALAAAGGGDETLRQLVRAADQFVLTVPARDGPAGHLTEVASSYPWAPPSPRHSLAGFCGLFLVPGRATAGRDLLLRLAGQLADGLLPSALPEAGGRPLYHGVDTSLWFVNAVRSYLNYAGDAAGVRGPLFDAVLSIVHWYREGTALGIRTDIDGLLSTNQPGVPTTWMDAQADGWVVTPRGGKAVEVNALWHNALCCAAELADHLGRPELSADLARVAAAARASFNRRFWNPATNGCFDTIDDLGSDPAVRPNQLLAVSLPYPALTPNRFEALLDTVRTRLMTPYGPRTLDPGDHQYRGHYSGDIVARDRAYHQGSVHPWLMGHYVTAYLKVHGRGPGVRAEARQLLEPLLAYFGGPGLGQLPELFDGEPPHAPGGAIAAAASVAEVLRAYAQDVLDQRPTHRGSSSATDPAQVG